MNTPEETITYLAAHIKHMEFEGNFVRFDFDTSVSIDEADKNLKSAGITEIVSKYSNGISKSEISPVFILKYQYSPQKKIIDNLEHRFVRMSALKTLLNYGGLQLTADEKAYFDKETAKAAALKMAGKTK